MASLESVRCKIFRAKEHYETLHIQLDELAGKQGQIVMKPDLESMTMFATFYAPGVPARVPLIIGDCLQNLRSSLDYLIWELVQASKNVPSEKNAFPICRTEQAFKDAIRRGRLGGIPTEASAIIEGLQPYTHGQNWPTTVLAILDELSNINKHRRILLTQMRMDIAARGIPNRHFEADLQTLEAENVQMDEKFVAFVAFEEGVAKGAEVCSILDQIAKYIMVDILPSFEKFFV